MRTMVVMYVPKVTPDRVHQFTGGLQGMKEDNSYIIPVKYIASFSTKIIITNITISKTYFYSLLTFSLVGKSNLPPYSAS